MRLKTGLFSLLFFVGCSSQKNTLVLSESIAITGGTDVQSNDAIASFTVGIYDQKNDFICTGSLIQKNLVITAAHCIEGQAQNLFIIFDLNLSGIDSNDLKVLRKAKSVRVHPEFKGLDSDELDWNDIAMIEFEGTIPESYHPIEILKDENYLQRGSPVFMAGFGASQVDFEEISKRDRSFKQGLSSGEITCSDKSQTFCYRLQFSGSDTLRSTSASIEGFTEKEIRLNANKGHGTCVGDSGGPLLLQLDKVYYLIGVTSRGNELCNGPAVYTNVLEYKDWI